MEGFGSPLFLGGKMGIKLNVIDGAGALVWKLRTRTPWDCNLFGTKIFCGAQGSGKTLSAVRWVRQLADIYPAMQICTNLELHDFPLHTEILEYTGVESLFEQENGEQGIVYLIDEIQLELNSLESRQIPLSVITEISQQRKQKKMIVGTAQVLMRLAKPIREQFDQIIDCKCIGGVMQWNHVYSVEDIKQTDAGEIASIENGRLDMFFHSVSDYLRYDTAAKVLKRTKDYKALAKKYDAELYGGVEDES